MSKSCVHAYTGVSITETSGNLNPCCIFKRGNLPTIFQVDTLNNLHSLEPYKRIQQSLDSGEYISECVKCQQHEAHGIKSKRMHSNHLFFNETLQYGYVQDLEIALDYTCNMMCRICSPFASSKWGAAKEVIKDLEQQDIEHYNFDSSIYKKYQDRFYKVFDNTDFKHVKHLKIEGGEPFYAKNFEWFLDKLYNESVDRSAVKLNIFTNGSIFPKNEILKKLESFNTTITFSLDAHGDLASVIRYGVEWKEVEQAVRQWAYFSKNNSLQLCTNTTLSILNVNMINDLVDFCDDVNIDINYNDLHDPSYFSMYQLPINIREKWKSSRKDSFNQYLLADVKTTPQFETFLKATEVLDKYQKNSFKDVNPEMYNIIKEISK